MSRLWYPSQILAVDVHAEQDAARQQDCGHDGFGFGELFPVGGVEDGVPVAAGLDLGEG